MRNLKQIYLAHPFGFSEAGRFFRDEVLCPAVANAGCALIDPWQLGDRAKIRAAAAMPFGIGRKRAWRRLNSAIGEINTAAIDQSDGVIAVLDGVDVDSGTASEVGYAFARGKPIIGYRGDYRLSADNDGSIVNLQVEYFIRKSGGLIVVRVAQLIAAVQRLSCDRLKSRG